MPQGYDAGVHPNAQGWKGRVGFRPGRQAAFLGRLFMASDQAQTRRGPNVWPRQSRQEFEQRLLGDFAASALHAGEARQPPARAEAQSLGLEGPVAREAAAQRQACGAGAFRRRHHHLSAGARRRSFRHHACPAERGKEERSAPFYFLLQLIWTNSQILPQSLHSPTRAAHLTPHSALPAFLGEEPLASRTYSPSD